MLELARLRAAGGTAVRNDSGRERRANYTRARRGRSFHHGSKLATGCLNNGEHGAWLTQLLLVSVIAGLEPATNGFRAAGLALSYIRVEQKGPVSAGLRFFSEAAPGRRFEPCV
jgi:hypothetical protein